ncbi:hypothetical protein ACRAWF_45365 [Streptomyces sp. L7]
MRFEVTAAFVPDAQSAYLLGATTYTGVQLTPGPRPARPWRAWSVPSSRPTPTRATRPRSG